MTWANILALIDQVNNSSISLSSITKHIFNWCYNRLYNNTAAVILIWLLAFVRVQVCQLSPLFKVLFIRFKTDMICSFLLYLYSFYKMLFMCFYCILGNISFSSYFYRLRSEDFIVNFPLTQVWVSNPYSRFMLHAR